MLIGQYLTLEEFCTCTQTYQKYADQINPYPENWEETIPALEALCQHILDPIITHFGRERFQLTYGFCSKDLKRFLAQKDPVTGIKNGRVDPSRDQHMAHEKNRNGKYYCSHLGAACDFRITGLGSVGDSPCNGTYHLVEWILEQQLPFDSLYYYGSASGSETLRERPIHISYAPQRRRNIWAFTDGGVPTRKGIENWIKAAKPLN
ncbi:MAG: hypothetical protein SNJ57_14355 [Cyanobacteriota bacterium]